MLTNIEYWNGDIILRTFSSPVARKFAILTNSGASSDKNVIKPIECLSTEGIYVKRPNSGYFNAPKPQLVFHAIYHQERSSRWEQLAAWYSGNLIELVTNSFCWIIPSAGLLRQKYQSTSIHKTIEVLLAFDESDL